MEPACWCSSIREARRASALLPARRGRAAASCACWGVWARCQQASWRRSLGAQTLGGRDLKTAGGRSDQHLFSSARVSFTVCVTGHVATVTSLVKDLERCLRSGSGCRAAGAAPAGYWVCRWSNGAAWRVRRGVDLAGCCVGISCTAVLSASVVPLLCRSSRVDLAVDDVDVGLSVGTDRCSPGSGKA